jgi:hypothetical protein
MARRSLVTFGVLALASAITSTARADDPPGQPAPREPEKPAPREPEPVAPSTWGAPTETAAPTSPDTSSEGATPSTDAPPVISGHDTPPLGVFPTPGDELIDPRMARRWGEGPARWFLATTVDVGFVYGRPRASIGYGKPFTSWFGLDVNPVASSNGLGAYGGLRLELPFFDVRGGVRYFSAFSRTYLDRKAQYDRLALETESDRGAAKVVTLETEADLSLPLGPGNILARGSVSYVTNVPDGFNVFEETLRVIVQPPFVWRGRAGYAFRFGKYQQHSLAVVADFLHVPARDDYRTLRIGPVIRFVLSRRVEVRGSFVTTAYSIDKIGLRGGDFTELGVRYRWATE